MYALNLYNECWRNPGQILVAIYTETPSEKWEK